MTRPSVSVIIVSRGRPEALAHCLNGVSRLLYPVYEVVVVADPAGMNAIGEFAEQIRTVSFDQANIAMARNLGIAASGGEILAFIDDDAVPEPTWLNWLTVPFARSDVAAVGGYVRGRNGITYQWRARLVDRAGRAIDLQTTDAAPVVPALPAGHAIKTEGTNMAFRRDVLADLGGFDPAYRFFLDETDVNIRLADKGHVTAIAPMAEVHHATAASDMRRTNRAVTDLTEVGASHAIFLRKHCPEADWAGRWCEIQQEQRRRLVQQMVQGRLEPRDVARLMQSLADGYAQGQARELTPLAGIAPAKDFLRFASRATAGSRVLAGRLWSARRLQREAAKRAGQGETVSLFLFSHTMVFHRVRFHCDGYWLQRGGLWGRSDRRGRVFQPWSFAGRLQAEMRRVAVQRGIQLRTEKSS